MPTYEYQCASCGHQFEAFQKINDAPITECPQCHKNDVTKLISAANFQLKGTGWYATDFRDKGKPKPKESTETQDSKPETDKKETKEKSKSDSSTTTKDSTSKDSTE